MLNWMSLAWDNYEARQWFDRLAAARPDLRNFAVTLSCGPDGPLWSSLHGFPNCFVPFVIPGNPGWPLEHGTAAVSVWYSWTFLGVNGLGQKEYKPGQRWTITVPPFARKWFIGVVPAKNPSPFPPVTPWDLAPYVSSSPFHQSGNVPDFLPNGRMAPETQTETKTAPYHPWPTPPADGVVERKSKLKRTIALLAHWAFMVTEGIDLINALHKALPKRYQSKSTKPQDQLLALLRHYDKIDMDQAVRRVIFNQLVDAIWGRISGLSERQLRNLGREVYTSDQISSPGKAGTNHGVPDGDVLDAIGFYDWLTRTLGITKPPS